MPMAARKIGPKGRQKIASTMREYAAGTLRSGSKQGPKVGSQNQALAIALNQAAIKSRLGKRKR
jgi:Family of unknown function (DUF6496)